VFNADSISGDIRHAKLQSNHHLQQTNTQFFTGWMPYLSPNQQCHSTEGNPVKNVKCEIDVREWCYCWPSVSWMLFSN